MFTLSSLLLSYNRPHNSHSILFWKHTQILLENPSRMVLVISSVLFNVGSTANSAIYFLARSADEIIAAELVVLAPDDVEHVWKFPLS